jgi:hypothetical protein
MREFYCDYRLHDAVWEMTEQITAQVSLLLNSSLAASRRPFIIIIIELKQV